MQIVIDISEDYYNMLKYDVEHGNDYVPIKLIANGTPLTEEWDCNSCPWSDSRRMYNEGIERGLWMQEQVIEDIKAEIQALDTSYCGGYIGLSKQEVMDIIDKYKEVNE